MLTLNHLVSLPEPKAHLSFFDWHLSVVCGRFCRKLSTVLLLLETNVPIEKENHNRKCVDIFKKWLIKPESQN